MGGGGARKPYSPQLMVEGRGEAESGGVALMTTHSAAVDGDASILPP